MIPGEGPERGRREATAQAMAEAVGAGAVNAETVKAVGLEAVALKAMALEAVALKAEALKAVAMKLEAVKIVEPHPESIRGKTVAGGWPVHDPREGRERDEATQTVSQ